MDKRVNIKDPIKGWVNNIQDWDVLIVGDIFRQLHPVSHVEYVETDTVYEVVAVLGDEVGGLHVNILEE